MKNLLLIDGSGYIFRAFYALPVITRSDGTPINAVYGFVKMLMKLIKESKSDYIAVIFDAARRNYRNDIYPDYKGTRKEVPPELVPQFPLIREAVKSFNIACIEEEGYEGDDLIAAYAKEAMDAGINVKVVSSDKDMMQLVAKGIVLYDPMKHTVIGEKDIQEKFGVPSSKLLDTMSLIGDVSDNVPGVTGIGKKTAAELINQFGSLDNLFNNLDKIKQPKRRDTLEKEKDKAFLSRRLIALAEDAPLPVPLVDLGVRTPDCGRIVDFARVNEFNSLLPLIDKWCEERISVLPIRSISQKYRLINSKSELKNCLKKACENGIISIDTETTSLNVVQADLVGFSFCGLMGEAYYVPIGHTVVAASAVQGDLFSSVKEHVYAPGQMSAKDALSILSSILSDKRVLKVGHNIKYDMHVLSRAFRKHDIPFSFVNYDDTMLMSYVLYGSSHGHSLDELASLYLDYNTVKYSEVAGEGRHKVTFDSVPPDKALFYAAEDADITLRLYQEFRKKLSDDSSVLVYENIDRKLLLTLYDMEEKGIKIDTEFLKKLSLIFAEKINSLEEEIYAAAGLRFNINSSVQLGKILFDDMGIKAGSKTSTGAWKVDSEVLERLADGADTNEPIRLASLVLEYRKFVKLKTTYTDVLPYDTDKQGRIHTTFWQTSTSTGRLSSSEPNLQNIPVRTDEGKEIRLAFIADSGKLLLSADYSQVELRVMAEIANVPHLKEAFLRGEDIHAATAAAVFNLPPSEVSDDMRRRAKAVNFGIIYGISPLGLSKQIGVSRQEAADYIDAYFYKYPEIKSYMDRTIQQAGTDGYVKTITGRKCFINGMNEGSFSKRGFAKRAAINAPIQGSAADIIKLAMNVIPSKIKELGLDACMLLQVHDELVFEVKKEHTEKLAQLVKEEMENVIKLSVPLRVDVGIGNNWAEAH